jgi:hypothetical protein
MKIMCMLDKQTFKNKPNSYETGGIQKRLSQVNIEIEELANLLSNGATFKPALLNGTKSSDWISQQIFALDFDDGTTIQNELERCKQLEVYPAFGYTSFSYTEERQKFRLVFCSDEVITDIKTRNIIQNILITIFPTSDSVTFDPTRLFYGGRNLINVDYNNRLNVSDIMDKYKDTLKNIVNSVDLSLRVRDKEDISSYITDPLSHKGTNVNAISKLDVDTMKNILNISNSDEIILTTDNDFYTYINKLDLYEYLDIGDTICCILPGHDDNYPSAHIYTANDGTQIYKCFGCNRALTIISITEKLANCKRSEAIEYLKKVYNIKLEKSDWQKQQIQMLIDNVNYLDSDDFQIAFPELSKLIRTRKHHLQKMMIYFTQFVNEDILYNDRLVFFSGYSKLLEVCGINPNKPSTLSQSIILFTLLNLIIKLNESQIPEDILKEAKEIALKYGHKKLTNFYSFDEYGVNLLEQSEKIANCLKENNMTLKGLSKEYVLRTFGIETADRIFPQFTYSNKKGTSKKSNDRTEQIAKQILESVDTYGYILEKDIKVDGMTERQWKRSIQEILDSYDLVKITANQEIKDIFGIEVSERSYPKIIVKREG